MTSVAKFEAEQEERRSAVRHNPEEPIDIDLLTGGRRLRAVVQDVSVGGMRLVLAADCPIGTAVRLEHPAAGSFRGVCIWRDGQAIGVELVEPAREIERALQCVCLLIGLRPPR